MYNFLENAKLYLKIREEMGAIGSNYIHISVDRIKKLSKFFSSKVRLDYDYTVEDDNKYFYYLTIDGVDFMATSNYEEACNEGLRDSDFRRRALIWG